MDRSALVAKSQKAIDDATRLSCDPVTTATMLIAAEPVAALGEIRLRVLGRDITATDAYEGYRKSTTALLGALRLTNPPGADALGRGPLAALDALMRSNEEASSAGSILVALAGGLPVDRSLLTEAISAKQQHIERFAVLVPAAEMDLVDSIDHGQAGDRFDGMVNEVQRAEPSARPVPVSEAITGAISYTSLRRLAQDRVARAITGDAQSRASAAGVTAIAVGGGAVCVLLIVVGLGMTVSRSISRPLRRLTQAAGVVADLARAELIRVADSDEPDPAPPKLAAVDVASTDEIGELAVALNRVQATAALLLERQVTTRRNIAVMFANIARRTQNLVGRQLSFIDDLERNERSLEALQRLYRLDHVATRLRRSADSLLVVSGTVDPGVAGVPSSLIDVIRSALAEIEGFRSVQLREISEVTVSAGLVADLRLMLAELLENATNFSPPGTEVEVSATLDDECRIVIVDHGLGMSPARLDEENRRLVERERLELAPTTVLGLFVVGRLARRHRLVVKLAHSDGRGVTATVQIPARLLSLSPVLPQQMAQVRGPRGPERLAIEAAEVARVVEPTEHFAWFSRSPDDHGGVPADAAAASPNGAEAPTAPAPTDRAPTDPAPTEPAPTPTLAEEPVSQSADAAVGRASVPGVDLSQVPLPRRTVVTQPDVVPLAHSTAPAAVGQPVGSAPSAEDAPMTRSGLTRRIPGTHMVDPVVDVDDDSPTDRIVARDPEAERAALNDYLAGLARTTEASQEQQSRPSVSERQS